jgi:hypothetical protein
MLGGTSRDSWNALTAKAERPRVYGGEKVGHWSGGVMPLRAE